MADILKLKKKAADFEAKKQMEKALATYREMIEVYESGEEDPIDIPLYNRVGDLLQKAGNLPEAVAIWERAVDHYAEGGFYNPAIALCNKILRQSPGRTVVYYKLGKISAEKGFKADARQNFLEYASRMQKSGNLDEAFRALKEFADLVPDQDDVRLMLADQLVKADRKPEAIEQLQVAYAQCVRLGRTADADGIVERMKAIDPSVEPRSEEGGGASKGGGLVFLDLDPAPGPTRASIRTAPADIKRVTKAIAGLDLLDTGMEAPSAKPAVKPAAATPAVVPAAVTPVATPTVTPPSNAIVIEPTSVAGSVETDVPPSLRIETTASLSAPPESPIAAPSDLLIEPTSFSGAVPPAPRGSISGLVATALDEPPADLPMLDMGQGAAPAVDESTIEPIETVQKTGSIEVVEMIETIDVADTVETVETVEMVEIAEAASAEIPLLEITDAGREVPPTPVSTPVVELPMLEPEPIVEVPAPALTDFGSFGVAEEASPTPGFDLLEIESSEGVHALPLDANYVESQPSLIESAPESLLPPMAPEEELVVAPPTRATSTVLANSVELLHARVESAPDDWPLRRQYAEALLDDGQREAGVAELEATLAGFEATGDLDTAASVAEEIVRLAPGVIKYHQKRVEFAFRANDRMRLAEAYVELADALLKDGQGPKARVVYQRVLEIAPDDLRAQAALETIKEEPAAAAPPPRRSTTAMKKPAAPAAPEKPAAKAAPAAKKDEGDFVSLGDWLREDDEPKSTRMVVEEKEPTGDEQADFADMLRKFKQGVSDNVDEEDHEAHYDLGVAYKEMGLLDEAISEFQKSLRGANNRVRAIEALGQCFVEKGQLPVAATILQRALAEPGIGDDALIGVLYLLGTISEELHLFPDAKKHYQRVFAVDIQFRDIGDRLNAVEKKLS
ncbi:MAG: tetratricopeptide repeat protein [Gemmatimonadetes bacterium]|nr:tetratricopeptide repeat protein [Gemmatimonadota bacterium]